MIRIKYPRTAHVPWSPGASADDRCLDSTAAFEGQEVVVTTKLDGENTSLYRKGIHARSLSYAPHPSRGHMKALQARVGPEIPPGWRVCGENLLARHSIHYRRLAAYFQAFSVWDAENICLGWDATLEWLALLGLTPVPVLYRGPWDEVLLRGLHRPVQDGEECEGYVVRRAGAFPYRDFGAAVAKYVRANHVTTPDHWLTQPVVPNQLAVKEEVPHGA